MFGDPERDELDDETLRRCIRGDREARSRLVAMYTVRLLTYLTSLRFSDLSRADLEDIAQDTFIKTNKALPQFKLRSEGGPASFSAWMFEIAKRTAITWHRRRKNQGEAVSLDVVALASPDSPHRASEARELREKLNTALKKLSADHQEVLYLAELEGKSYEEIAQISHIPINTVKSRLGRARDALRKQMEGYKDEDR